MIVISKSLWLLSPVTRVDLSEEMILCSIRPVGVLAMTGMARGPLTDFDPFLSFSSHVTRYTNKALKIAQNL